jgi:SAM-dependent methyltransferase
MEGAGILESIRNMLNALLPEHRPVRVLEAGGGSCTHIDFDRERYVTTLDISPEQLDRNAYADEKVLGDLESWSDPKRYDLIVCWNVLEHLADPGRAMRNMMDALDDGGLLVVGCPNLYSIKGMVTRLTPHRFHVWYYREIRGGANAGKPGYAPFRTFLRRESSFRSVVRMAETGGFDLPLARCYPGPEAEALKRRSPFLHGMYRAAGMLAGAVTLGRFQAMASDWAVVMRKPGAGRPAAASVPFRSRPATAAPPGEVAGR